MKSAVARMGEQSFAIARIAREQREDNEKWDKEDFIDGLKQRCEDILDGMDLTNPLSMENAEKDLEYKVIAEIRRWRQSLT
jgi:hypothetical protein